MFIVDTFNEEGVWTEFEGAHLLIASSAGMAYQKKMARLYRPHRKAFERGNMDPEVARSVICKSIAGALLCGWRGVGTSDGNELPFTDDAAYNVLLNNEDLREFVQEFAGDVANFRAESAEETVKP